MPARAISRAFFIVFTVMSLNFCQAQAPSGPVTLSFDAATAPVWDLNGNLDITQTLKGAGGTDIEVSFSIPITHEPDGRLHGSGGGILVNVGGNFFASDFTAMGRISGGGANTRVSLVVRLKGQDVIVGTDTPFEIVVNYRLKVDPETSKLVGDARGSAKFSRLHTGGTLKSAVSIPLPNADGSWSVQLNVLALKGLVGNGTFNFPDTRTLPANLTGSFSAKSNLSKVQLTGFNEGKGSSVSLVLNPASETPVQRLRGRVLGQTVRE